jgi:hypothetical protein
MMAKTGVKTQNSGFNFVRVRKMLKRAKTLPKSIADDPTFLELTGYPHFENVASNLLAFFLDPARSHGLGRLMLDALLEDKALDLGFVSVGREVGRDGRIDITVLTDSHLIIIENKILSGIGNPLDKYALYAERNANGRTIDKILLVLTPPIVAPQQGFRILTYASFLEKVRIQLKSCPKAASPRYKSLLEEFITTIENLHRRRSNMTPEQLQFFKDVQEDLDEFQEYVYKFKRELKNRTSELGRMIDTEKYRNVRQRIWQGEHWVSCTLAHDVLSGKKALMGVEANLSAGGWSLSIYRHGADMRDIESLLKKLRISYDGGDAKRLPLHKDFPYDEPLVNVQEPLQQILDKVANGVQTSF